MADQSESPTELTVTARIEALLFVAAGPVSPNQIAAALDLPTREIESALNELAADLQTRGLRLQNHQGRFQLTTAPELGSMIEKFLGLETTSRLSQAALETLAVIAYMQPATRPQIDAVRGVNSDTVLKSLLSKGLVQEVGRASSAGRPILYSTTTDFLQHFGFNSIKDLPPLNLEIAAPPTENTEVLKG